MLLQYSPSTSTEGINTLNLDSGYQFLISCPVIHLITTSTISEQPPGVFQKAIYVILQNDVNI